MEVEIMFLHRGIVIPLLCIFILTCVSIWSGHKLRHQQSPLKYLEVLTGLVFLTYWLYFFGRQFFLPTFNPAISLPLHLCYLVSPIAAINLIYQSRFLRSIPYYLGLSLTTQAMITPLPLDSYFTLGTSFFWVAHGLIIIEPLYHIFAKGMRLTNWDYFKACGFTIVYGASMIILDFIKGWNYGFVGRQELGVGTILNFMGPWPERIIWIVIACWIAISLTHIPWLIYYRNKKIRN